jgi:hypothetical protein
LHLTNGEELLATVGAELRREGRHEYPWESNGIAHLFHEPGCLTPYVCNLTKQKLFVSEFEFLFGV